MIRPARAGIRRILSRPAPSLSPAARPVIKAPARTPTVLIVNGAALHARSGDGLGPLAHAGQTQTVFRSIDEIACRIEPGAARVYETVTGRDLAEFDLVQVLSHPRPTGALLSTIADHLAHHGRPATNMAGIGTPTRILQTMRLARAGVPVPVTVYLPEAALWDAYPALARTLGEPFLLTALGSFRAGEEWLIDSAAGLTGALARARRTVMAQQFIPNQGVYRMLVMGDRVTLATGPRDLADRRAHEISRDPDQLLDLGTLDPDASRTAVRAAQVMGYEICAVLMIRHMLERTWHVIEAHFSPEIGAGPHPGLEIERYAAYLERRLSSDTQSEVC